jgi:SsrA-binding protein
MLAGTSKRSRRWPGGRKRHRTLAPRLDTYPGLPPLLATKGAQMPAKSDSNIRLVAQNRKARFNYQIGETFEAGIALTGTEVKSLRSGKATIAESYADSRGGEIWLVNANIPEYLQGGRFNHAPKRMRKLLLHRRQINKLMGAVEREGMTLVPLKLYFNEKGRAKLELALARGKKLHDKRESEKRRSWERERGRLLRAKA